MRQILIGGDGFVGRFLARDLAAMGEEVVVADIQKTAPSIYDTVRFARLDITNADEVARFDIRADDMVYNLSAKMLSPITQRAKRRDFFWPVNHEGVEHILRRLYAVGCPRLVQFTTDMVYGHTLSVPTLEDHPTKPLGEYGLSKLATETLCNDYRRRGMQISLFRPRLIIGPGRLGILTKLFVLIDHHLPVPMIGVGRNPYQLVSVYDCARAARLAWQNGVPNKVYNLGSDDPPPLRDLLARLIREAGSYSVLLPTWAPLVKRTLDLLDWMNVPIMDPEQYKIADEVCILDTSAAKHDLGWRATASDTDMLLAAYWDYRAGRGDSRTVSRTADQLQQKRVLPQ
jgi:dTDP-glucose 4,6-dehydratase